MIVNPHGLHLTLKHVSFLPCSKESLLSVCAEAIPGNPYQWSVQIGYKTINFPTSGMYWEQKHDEMLQTHIHFQQTFLPVDRWVISDKNWQWNGYKPY